MMYSATPQPPPIPNQYQYAPALEGCFYGPPSAYADVVVRPGELAGEQKLRAERISALSQPTQRVLEINQARLTNLGTQRASEKHSRAFSGSGNRNQTHHRLFSLPPASKPFLAVAHDSRATAAAASATIDAHGLPASSARSMHDYAEISTHRGLTSVRQRTSCPPTEAVDAPVGNQDLTLHKDYEWTPDPFAAPGKPYDHRGLRAAHRVAASAAVHGHGSGRHFTTDACPAATGRVFREVTHHDPRVAAARQEARDQHAFPYCNGVHGADRGRWDADGPRCDALKRTNYLRLGRGLAPTDSRRLGSQAGADHVGDPFAPAERVRAMTATATTARKGHRYDQPTPAAAAYHDGQRGPGGWRDAGPLAPLPAADDSRVRQETVWSASRTCAHDTQGTVRRTQTARQLQSAATGATAAYVPALPAGFRG